ncbi:hypothetical protein ACN47E_003880 [Coniothyrium glycines]
MSRQPSYIQMPSTSSALKAAPVQLPVQLPKPSDRPDEPWHHYLTVDLIWYVLGYTLFHPFVSWILVLCLRAQYTPYGNTEMRAAMAWAMLMTAIGIFGIVSDRIAFGSPREIDLAEEVIVVTGGVDGLGGLLAETYGMRNANIAVLDLKHVGQDEAEEKGVVFYQCDVSDATQVEQAVAKVVKDLGPPTILINNAGIVHFKPILETTAAEVERTFQVNTLSHFHTLRAFLPHMLKEGRGTIVTVSSVLGHLGSANLSAYTASKAALLALHHSLRAELAQDPKARDIKTILVTPGLMSTKMFAGIKTPNFLGPVVTPAEIAKEIIRLIERGESGDIALPLYSRWIHFLGVMPTGVQTLIRRFSGLDTAVGKAGLTQKAASDVK